MGEANSAESATQDSCTAGNTRILIDPVKEPGYKVLVCRGIKVPHQSDLVISLAISDFFYSLLVLRVFPYVNKGRKIGEIVLFQPAVQTLYLGFAPRPGPRGRKYEQVGG